MNGLRPLLRTYPQWYSVNMFHDFFLTELSENPRFNFSCYHDKTPSVSIHNDLIEYIGDSLSWLSTYNPATSMEKQTGLNLCGPTVLKSADAKHLYYISKCWSELFKLSPNTLNLTGSYSWIDDKIETGRYERLVFDRDEVVASFEFLAATCLKVSESNDTSFIMHFGL